MTVEIKRLMPSPIDMGTFSNSTLEHATGMKSMMEKYIDYSGKKEILGFVIPEWQRPLVWTDEQKIKLIESLWLGLNIGTYTYTTNDKNPDLDLILVDGQQRMNAIQEYINDGFKVFGYLYSETTIIDKRKFRSLHFSNYVLRDVTEQEMKDYYNMMNFSGTNHTEDQKV